MNRRELFKLGRKVGLVALAAQVPWDLFRRFGMLAAYYDEAQAATLPQNLLVQAHRGYLWRADGSSATQGTGSIATYPTKTTGTVSYTLSQVTTSPTGVMPPGSGSLIKAVISGGASGGNITINIKAPGVVMQSLGNFGIFYHQDTGGNTDQAGPTFYLGDSTGMTNSLRPAAAATTTNIQRHRGWNLFNWQRGDSLATTGSFSYDSTTITDMWILWPMVANKTITVYFGDWLYGYYTRPQAVIWSADNGRAVYETMFPYMQARGMVGSYVPWANWLESPTGSQLTVANLLEMQSAGWAVHAHGYSYAGNEAGYAVLPIAQVRADMMAGQAALARMGFKFSPFFYPNGGGALHTQEMDDLYAELGYTHGNNANAGATGDSVPRYQYGGLMNPYAMWSLTCDTQHSPATIAAINNLVKYGGHLPLLYHSVDDVTATTADFKAVIDHLYRLRESNVLDVVNWDAVMVRQTSPRKLRAS